MWKGLWVGVECFWIMTMVLWASGVSRGSLIYSFLLSSFSSHLELSVVSMNCQVLWWFIWWPSCLRKIQPWNTTWGYRMIPDCLWSHCDLMEHYECVFIKKHNQVESITLLIKLSINKTLVEHFLNIISGYSVYF